MRRGRRKGCAKPAVTNRPKRSSRCPPHARAAWTGAGRGNAYYGQTAADLAEPFAAEFPLLTSMCARDLMLTLHAPENVGVELVLEDVDLVGGHRDGPFAVAGGTLNLLLDEMDGLAPEARVLFVLTTNRPEVLEPALAARPGRVDQVIEIGLPGEAERRLLVKRYVGGLHVTEDLAAETAARVGLVSPAFIKELMRRAAQTMLERSGDDALKMEDIEQALVDMLGAGGRFAARMLGAESAIGFADVA